MSDVTAILNRLNDINRTNIKVVNRTITNSDDYMQLATMVDEYSISEVNLSYIDTNYEHHMIFEVIKSADRSSTIKIKYNEFTNTTSGEETIPPISSIKVVDNVYIYLDTSPTNYQSGELNISAATDVSSANIFSPSSKSSIIGTTNSTIDLSVQMILTDGDDFQIYRDSSGDIVLDGLDNRIKVKTTASGYEDEIYITGDSTYGVSTEKIKENIEDANYADIVNFIRSIDIKKFNYKEDYDSSKREDISFIIEELPEGYIKDILVEYNENGLDKYSINTLLMLLLATLKEEVIRSDKIVNAFYILNKRHDMLERRFELLDDAVGMLVGEKLNGQ
jgi:hypothetical protein